MNNFTTELLNNTISTISTNSSPNYYEILIVIPILLSLLIILLGYKNNRIKTKKNQIIPV
jgi:hypothetical protein